ncbi:rab11 family-interacting protein 2 isoform X1 [Carcharodon carcharias]|uniref:rab11 family-interacting protein 2 isoform X1 n=1 Tax=Carcharodon carcharias TaxID=13397 RepID=UPI001B7F292C|nr:rab11 family-interacting protein 2 isoform X1 [Carcharodon carcharias]
MMLAEQSQTWFPTHVQVTVMQARDLNPKGKSGTNDTYTIIQLGKEKYSTSVAEKTLCPIWKEEVSFEFPGLLLQGTPEKYILHLIVMHRSLVGLDKFLGQVAICLNELFENKSRRQKEWFKLESKPGKKSKERGAIQVSIQFMRNNMTASMFDLSMKDKTRSPFAKLKDKMKGRKKDATFSDHSSAIIPSTTSTNPDQEALEIDNQLKSKPKRAFLLGPQRLSSAQSMSDLPGPRPSLGKIKSNTIGHVVYKPPSDSVHSSEERGNDSLAKSPHRRSQSMDTSKVNQFDLISVTKNGNNATKSPADPFSKQGVYVTQKAATLPRSRNPFDNSNDSWQIRDTSLETTANYRHPEIKRETKRDKEKEKISLFARVTGKKDVKKSEKAANMKADGFSDAKPVNPFSGNFHSSFEFDSKNPFVTNYNTVDMSCQGCFAVLEVCFDYKCVPPGLDETIFLLIVAGLELCLTKPINSEDMKVTESTLRHKYLASDQHSSNTFKQHHFEYYEDKTRDPGLLATGYRNLSYDELIYELVKHKELVKRKDGQIRELEDYIDNLLVRVMEETPSILRVPYEPSRKAGKLSKNN